jgi:hypothetical protein
MRATFKYKNADPEQYNVESMTDFMAAAYCAFSEKSAKAQSAVLEDVVEDDSNGELYYDTIKTVKRATKVDVIKTGIRDIKKIIKYVKKDAGIKGLSVRITFENKDFSEKDLSSIMKLAK